MTSFYNVTDAAQFAAWAVNAPETADFFQPQGDIVVARAPGRLDLMGGIADYSGSLVLQWPIREAAWVALQATPEQTISVLSLGSEDNDRDMRFQMPIRSLLNSHGKPISYTDAGALMASHGPRAKWASYIIGVFLVLIRERGLRLTEGVRLLIASDVPEGKGVSSSAALEVATMQAVAKSYELVLSGRDLGMLCQVAENSVVGAPCGVMDQISAACGEAGALLALLCRPAELLGQVRLPDGLCVWGIASGVRHSVAGADYGTVRTAAFMGLAIIERRDKVDLGGYLTRLTPSEFTQCYADELPHLMSGSEFSAAFGHATATRLDVRADTLYPIRAATAHPVFEHFRVQAFMELLQTAGASQNACALLGELMYQSHTSYSACGLGSSATDRLVELVRGAAEADGLFGAKITGGGSGGTVAVFGRCDSGAAIERIVEQYSAETGDRPHIFTGSSSGAVAFGVSRFTHPLTDRS